MNDTPQNMPGFPQVPPPQGDGQAKVPPPPPEITIRTMQTDVKSMTESGGGAPLAQPFAAPTAPPEEKITIPGYTGPEEAVFTPETLPAQGSQIPGGEVKKTSAVKIIAIILGVLVLAAGLGAAGYYFVYPLIFPPAQVAEVTPPAPVAPSEPAPAPAPAPTIIMHKSLLAVAADKVEKITTPESTTSVALRDAIGLSAAEKLDSGSLKEIYFADANENILYLVNFLTIMVPELAALQGEIGSLFEEDFTTLLYYDGTNSWPVYIAKLKAGANEILAKTAMNELEKYKESLKNFFVTDPGAAAADGFKDGQLNLKPARYMLFSQAGAAIDLVWFDNYFMIATNYKAAQEAGKLLGFPNP